MEPSTMTASAASAGSGGSTPHIPTLSLDYICSIQDIFQCHVLSYLTYQDLGRFEKVSKRIQTFIKEEEEEHNENDTNEEEQDNVEEVVACCWKILCERDYTTNNNGLDGPVAPIYDTQRRSFDTLEVQPSWKEVYHKWRIWQKRTCNTIYAHHMIQSIQLWTRFKDVLQTYQLTNILDSLAPCPSRQCFYFLKRKLRQLASSSSSSASSSQQQQQQLQQQEHSMLKEPHKNWSSLLAFYAVHGGQVPLQPRSEDDAFFSGLFGSYSCYNDYYSMRLLHAADFCYMDEDDGELYTPAIETDGVGSMILVGISIGSPRTFLYWCPTENDRLKNTNSDWNGGIMRLVRDHPITIRNQHTITQDNQSPFIVGRNGILGYFEDYITRLEHGIYQPCPIIDSSPRSRGICLFPNENETGNDGTITAMTSCCVTRGIEVRASARWFPPGSLEPMNHGLNFGYSIRIRMVAASININQNEEGGGTTTVRSNSPPTTTPTDTTSSATTTTRRTTYQLVGRHWEFINGHGQIRRVDGEAVIGKQPLLYCIHNVGHPTTNNEVLINWGYEDLGPAGNGETYSNEIFRYQSQSGPVAGTWLPTTTTQACVRGTFSFVPGSIDEPTGPMFHVQVGTFPLTIPQPFY